MTWNVIAMGLNESFKSAGTKDKQKTLTNWILGRTSWGGLLKGNLRSKKKLVN